MKQKESEESSRSLQFSNSNSPLQSNSIHSFERTYFTCFEEIIYMSFIHRRFSLLQTGNILSGCKSVRDEDLHEIERNSSCFFFSLHFL